VAGSQNNIQGVN